MRIAACALLLAATLPLHLSAQAEEKVLNIYNWSDYIGPEALKAFQAETGIQAKYDVFDSPEALDSKLLTGGSGYDLVFPSSSGLARAVKAKAVQAIDHSSLTLYSNLDPDLLGKLATSDPGNRYGVPYTWGTVGLGLNKQAVSKRLGADVPLNTLDLLFKPEYASKLKDCGIGVLDSPQEVISIALNYLGHDPYSDKPADLKEVQQLLAQLQPNVRYVASGRQIDDLAKGEVCMALSYSGDAATAAARAVEAKQPFEVVYRIPREGTLVWFDTMAIPVDAPHPQAALAFINYMLRPEAIAEVTNTVFFANANSAATALVDPAVTSDPDIYPPAEVRARLFSDQTQSLSAQRERTRLWTAFRSHY